MPTPTTVTMFGRTISTNTCLSATVYLLRLVQLTTLSISCFGACYLIWMHNHHYCAYTSCYGGDADLASVPLGEVIFVTCCIVQCLEWIYCTSSSLLRLSQGKRVDSITQLFGTWATLFLLTIGLGTFASIPDVRQTWPYCDGIGVTRFGSYYPVEKNMCIVTQSTVTTGLINWIASCLLAVLALKEVKNDLGLGGIRLPLVAANEGNNGSEYGPATDGAHERDRTGSGEDRISAMGVETPDSV